MTPLGATKEEKLEKLMRDLPRSSFPTSPRMHGTETPGVFSWNEKHIHFDYLGMGRLQRLFLLRQDVDDADGMAGLEPGDGWDFGPSRENQDIGERTEYLGTAHARWDTPLWKKRAWNTLNLWCSYQAHLPALSHIIRWAEDCYARVITETTVWYFLKPSDERPPHFDEGGQFKAYVAGAFRHAQWTMDPAWRLGKDMTKEQQGYVLVAWDQYMESDGAQRAPLHGVQRKKS